MLRPTLLRLAVALVAIETLLRDLDVVVTEVVPEESLPRLERAVVVADVEAPRRTLDGLLEFREKPPVNDLELAFGARVAVLGRAEP